MALTAKTAIGFMVVAISFAAAGCGKTPEVQPVAEVKLTGDQLCSRDLKKFIQFNDPDSVRINSVRPNDLRPGRYWMSVSAKNAYGGYGEPTTCSCGTDVPTGRVTDMYCDGMGG